MRKFVGMIIILTFLALYIFVAATIGGMLATAPVWVQIPYFALAGIFWAFPLKPLFKWVNKTEAEQPPQS